MLNPKPTAAFPLKSHYLTTQEKPSALKDLEPRYVIWGEGSSDEMRLGVIVTNN